MLRSDILRPIKNSSGNAVCQPLLIKSVNLFNRGQNKQVELKMAENTDMFILLDALQYSVNNG